jgi:hypothetical protein
VWAGIPTGGSGQQQCFWRRLVDDEAWCPSVVWMLCCLRAGGVFGAGVVSRSTRCISSVMIG